MNKRVWVVNQYIQIFIKRYYRIFLIGLLFGTAFFLFAPRVISKIPEPRPIEKIGMVGLYTEQNLPLEIVQQVSIGLTQIDEHGMPFPGLAASWKTDDQGGVWHFYLDQDITWSDGQPITAEDINLNFQDVETSVIDQHTIQFKLPNPFAPFPHVVSKPIFKDNFTGIGPYQLTNVTREGQYLSILEFEPITESSKLPIKRYRFYPTEDAAKLGFKIGEIDVISGLHDPSGFENWNNIQVTSYTQYQQIVSLLFNQVDSEGNATDFSQKSIRQALAYALSDKSMGRERAMSPIPSSSWAYNPDVKKYEYSQERAKELLADFQEADQPLSVTITTEGNLLNEAEAIAESWRQLDIDVKIQVVNVLPQEFDVLLITQEVPRDPDQYSLWHSTQPTNIIGYQNPKIDKLLEEGRDAIKQEDRKDIYYDFQRFMSEDLPAIPLYHPKTFTIKRV